MAGFVSCCALQRGVFFVESTHLSNIDVLHFLNLHLTFYLDFLLEFFFFLNEVKNKKFERKGKGKGKRKKEKGKRKEKEF
jgi:hypothetical protein